MITDIVDGFSIDCGAQFLMDSYPILTSLIASNSLSSNFIQTSQYLGTIRDGKIHKTSRNDPLSLLKAGTLSFQGWLRFLLRSILLMSKTNMLSINDYTAWTHYDDEETETWSNSFFGHEVTDYLVEPIFDGLFFQSLRDVSKAFAISILSTFLYRKTKNLTTIRGGIAVLPECLGSQLDVRLNTPVTLLKIGNSGVELGTNAGPIVADRVILATPAPISRSLFEKPEGVERELLATPYSSTIVVAIALQSSFHIETGIDEIYGFMVPKTERSVISTIANDAAKDKLQHADTHLFVVFLSGEAGKEMIDWEDKAILSVVLKEMEKFFTGISGNIRFTKIYRWKEAMALSPIGRCRNVARYREDVNVSTKVYLAGDYMGMPFTEGAAETGKWAADTLIKNLAL
jgi:oxygen-dependent protoporphyrinogen oxidase